MIYGLYLSATGILTSSFRQDVIANNIANSETVGFKRDMVSLQERPTAAQELGAGPSQTNALLEGLGGGMMVRGNIVDTAQGELESGGPNDMAIEGPGYFAIQSSDGIRLTRDGRFIINHAGHLIQAGSGQDVLSDKQQPVLVEQGYPINFDHDGVVSQNGKILGRIGIFSPGNPSKLQKNGATLMSDTSSAPLSTAGGVTLHPGFLERSNVDPATELVQLMDAQRQLEANANMIRYQDETLNLLANNVGKIS
jgi:flagellar basal body rod protein FlgG